MGAPLYGVTAACLSEYNFILLGESLYCNGKIRNEDFEAKNIKRSASEHNDFPYIIG
jgi:hypothetical protein